MHKILQDAVNGPVDPTARAREEDSQLLSLEEVYKLYNKAYGEVTTNSMLPPVAVNPIATAYQRGITVAVTVNLKQKFHELMYMEKALKRNNAMILANIRALQPPARVNNNNDNAPYNPPNKGGKKGAGKKGAGGKGGAGKGNGGKGATTGNETCLDWLEDKCTGNSKANCPHGHWHCGTLQRLTWLNYRSLPTRDHWATDDELAECWKQMKQMVEDGLWFVGDVAEIGVNGATACEIMLACLSKTGHSPHFMQNRQDVAHDVDHERALREKISQDFDMMFRARDLSQLPDEDDPDEETTFSFLPVSQKRDLVRFYYQCGSKDPKLSGIFFAKPFSLSHPRSEGEPKKALVILGMAYTLVLEIKIKAQVNPAKVLELLKKGRALILDIDNKCVKERATLNYKGLYRHVAQLDRLKIALAKALDFWQGKNFSVSIKKQSDRRQLRQSVLAMQDAATRVAPKILSAARSNMPVAHLYTDAAAENLSELSRLLQTGQRDGFEEFGLFLGGFLALPSGEKLAFKFQVTRFPQEVTKVTIGLLEAAAARIAIDYFKAELKGHYVVLHVDNLSDVYRQFAVG
eukprot:g11365.t1